MSSGIPQHKTNIRETVYETVAGKYDNLLGCTGDIWVRDAFHQVITEVLPKGSVIVDFGCGTGTDAAIYAGMEYNVIAYDSSQSMILELKKKYEGYIESKQIIPLTMPTDQFLSSLVLYPLPDAYTSNFGVLNEVDNLKEVFRSFAQHLSPNGYMIHSVLNPYFWKDILHSYWWKIYLQSFHGEKLYHRTSDSHVVYRHRIKEIVESAKPWFRLESMASAGMFIREQKGNHSWNNPSSIAEQMESFLWKTSPFNTIGKFIFFVFRLQS